MRLPLELDITLNERVAQLQPLGVSVCTAMQDHIVGMGIQRAIQIDFNQAKFRAEKDPFSGDYSLHANWVDQRAQPCGSMVFHADGSFFAEYDVIENHPTKPRWFVEAMTAWGRAGNIKVEPRLIQRV